MSPRPAPITPCWIQTDQNSQRKLLTIPTLFTPVQPHRPTAALHHYNPLANGSHLLTILTKQQAQTDLIWSVEGIKNNFATKNSTKIAAKPHKRCQLCHNQIGNECQLRHTTPLNKCSSRSSWKSSPKLLCCLQPVNKVLLILTGAGKECREVHVSANAPENICTIYTYVCLRERR